MLPISQWRHAVYSQWVFIGLAIICLVSIPETPRWYASKGEHDKARKVMKKIYGGVVGYDLDHEYAIVQKEIDDGKILANSQQGVSVLDCFRGSNLVSIKLPVHPCHPCNVANILRLSEAPNYCFSGAIQQPALGWRTSPLCLHVLLLPAGRCCAALHRHRRSQYCSYRLRCHQLLHDRPNRSTPAACLRRRLHGPSSLHYRWYSQDATHYRQQHCHDCYFVSHDPSRPAVIPSFIFILVLC